MKKAAITHVEISREAFIAALHAAYELGSEATKQANFSQNGITQTFMTLERRSLNKLVKAAGFDRGLTDEEIAPFDN